MSISVNEKILAYINEHPNCQGKSLEEIITIMLEDGSLNDVDFKEEEKISLFGENKDDNTCWFYSF